MCLAFMPVRDGDHVRSGAGSRGRTIAMLALGIMSN